MHAVFPRRRARERVPQLAPAACSGRRVVPPARFGGGHEAAVWLPAPPSLGRRTSLCRRRRRGSAVRSSAAGPRCDRPEPRGPSRAGLDRRPTNRRGPPARARKTAHEPTPGARRTADVVPRVELDRRSGRRGRSAPPVRAGARQAPSQPGSPSNWRRTQGGPDPLLPPRRPMPRPAGRCSPAPVAARSSPGRADRAQTR